MENSTELSQLREGRERRREGGRERGRGSLTWRCSKSFSGKFTLKRREDRLESEARMRRRP